MSWNGSQRQSKNRVPVAPEDESSPKRTSRPPAIAWLTPSEGDAKSVSIIPPSGLDDAPAEPEPPRHGVDIAPAEPVAARTAFGDPRDDRNESCYPAVDVDTRFFQTRVLTFESFHDFDEGDARQSLRLTPTVVRRRAVFAKYVKVAVGLSMALCAAALVKGAIARARPGDSPRAQRAAFAGSPAAVPEQGGASRDMKGSASDPSAPAPGGLATAAREQIPPLAEPAAQDKPATVETPPQRTAALAAPEPVVIAPPQQLAQGPVAQQPPVVAEPPAQAPVAQAPASSLAQPPLLVPAPQPPPVAPQHGMASVVVSPAQPVPAQTVLPPQVAAVQEPTKAPVVAAPHGIVTAPPGLPGAQAIAEKNASQAALEQGKAAASIAAGERSVALDPTDAESWLILGAAYQQQGNDKDARRCFGACIQKANRGPKRECAAMLR